MSDSILKPKNTTPTLEIPDQSLSPRASYLGAVVSAVRSIKHNGLRSMLTVSGITIGVLTITCLVAILQGVKSQISAQVDGLGANLILVVPSRLDDNGQPNFAAMAGISTLTPADVKALKQVPGVAKISPVYIISGNVSLTSSNSTSAFVVACNKAGVEMNPTRLATGSYYNDSQTHVCILGYQPAHDLFGTTNPVNKIVTIQGLKWKVVGVLAKPSQSSSLAGQLMALDTLVYLPDSAAKLIPGCQVNRIVIQTDYKHPADKVIADLTAVLMKTHHGVDDFGVITQKKGLELVDKLINMAQDLLVLISTISLLVAGIGIMNIMLVTITERTREIGIRKTVGAKQRDIFLQFILEALLLSFIGGCVGLALSWILCQAIAHFSILQPVITPLIAVMALAVCGVVGVLFGTLPAVRASRLDPINALRYE